MKKITCIGILLFNILLNTYIVAQNIPYMTKIDNEELKYIDNSEISIIDWIEYEFAIKNRFGANSPEFISVIPDTAFFNKHYNFSYISAKNSDGKYKYHERDVKFMQKSYNKYPMIGISYKQCVDYCKWRTEVYNYKIKGVEKVEFSLPSKEDFQKAELLANITYNPPLSILNKKKSGKPQGITDNVIEYSLENKDLVSDRPIGFRCVAKVTKR